MVGDNQQPKSGPRMNIHKNARTTPLQSPLDGLPHWCR